MHYKNGLVSYFLIFLFLLVNLLVFKGDDKVIDEAFHGRHVERAALRNKTGKVAISIIDEKVFCLK